MRAQFIVFVACSFVAVACATTSRNCPCPRPIAECPPPDAIDLDRNRLATVRVDNGGHGTGFFVSANGLIVTAKHVVDGAGNLSVHIKTAAGEVIKQPATVIATDGDHDLALLKTDYRPDWFVTLAANDEARTGDPVYVDGYPRSFGELVVRGHLMAVDHQMAFKGNITRECLVIDANGAPGNSGSAVFLDRNGKLIGIWQAYTWAGGKNQPLMVIHIGTHVRHIRAFLKANHVQYKE